MKKQLVVLADDFSGACEMAGIAFRYGLKVEVQLDFDPGATAEVIVFDSNTRCLPGELAAKKIRQFAVKIIEAGKAFHFFKKIDSVLRGNVISEAEILHHLFQKKQTYILPANPSKGRIIFNQNYFVNGIPIHLTAFKTDPDFPRESAFLPDLLDQTGKHFHLTTPQFPERNGLFTADITTPENLKQLIACHEDKLYCGAADAFEIFLQQSIPSVAKQVPDTREVVLRSELFLLVSGSTQHKINEGLLTKNDYIKQIILEPGFVQRSIVGDNQLFENWLDELNEKWNKDHIIFLSSPKKIIKKQEAPEKIARIIAATVSHLLKKNQARNIHILATGGAIASAIIQMTGSKRFKVIREMSPGVVTISDGQNRLITAKPGSYPWPEMKFVC